MAHDRIALINLKFDFTITKLLRKLTLKMADNPNN